MKPFIQDEMPYNYCWGCGSNNEHGLQLKSYWEGNEAVSNYHPQPDQMAGPKDILNGGIISTIIDCHSINTAIAHEYQLLERPVGSSPIIWFVTASLKVDFLLPTPINKSIELRAKVDSSTDKKKIVKCTLFSQGKATANGEVIAVQVDQEWHRMSQEPS